MVESILVFGAHSDDHIFGVGGTIANYAKEGKKVTAVIFSYGESSHIWLQRKYSVKMRVKEAKKASKLIGCEIVFLGLKEGRFDKEIKERGTRKRLRDLILKNRPSKIFIHSAEDPHPDHRSINNFILALIDGIKYDCDVYTYDIWNPLTFKHRDSPRMYVNINNTFQLKIKALELFESQWVALVTLMSTVYIRALVNGLGCNCRFAEMFYKLR